jgi:hypothetical protein
MVSGSSNAYSQRNGTTCAIVAVIDRRSGKIWARATVAHDCGQIINPDGLKHTIEATSSRHQPHAVGGGQGSTSRTSPAWTG